MAQKDMIKSLTSAELKKQNKVLDSQNEFVINIGGQKYKLTHDVTFRKSKMNRVLDDMVKFFQEAVNDIDILELATPYTALLIFKHFTSLEVSDDVSEALALLQVLVDLDALNQIIVELPEEELMKVYELVSKTIQNMSDSIVDAEEESKKLAEQVENPIVKDMIPSVND